MKQAKEEFRHIPLTLICPNPWNPRQRFCGPKFDELIASIDAKGVLEPILVRPLADPVLVDRKDWPNHGRVVEFEIVAGERRFRASHQVASRNGGPEAAAIPAIVRPLSDDEAFDIMTVENIQREDLTELEEARNFQMYLDRKGPDAIDELSARTGIHPTYIRRRVRVLALPKKVLEAWDKGKLRYGHLEQLCRIKGKAEINRWAKEALEERWDGPMTVAHLKRSIDRQSPVLAGAFFDLEKEGCPACAHNSEVQKKLFAVDQSDKALCDHPACFKQKQNNWLLANWKKSPLRRKYRTNGFIFRDVFDWNGHECFHRAKDVFPACKACERFVTVIDADGDVYHERICMDKACHAKNKKAHSLAQNKSDAPGGSASSEDNQGPRVAWHGEYFREIFYRKTIRERTENVPWNEHAMLRMLLFALIAYAGDTLGAWFARRHELTDRNGKTPEQSNYFFLDNLAALDLICRMDITQVHEDLGDAAIELILAESYHAKITASQRRRIGDLLGIDLAAEWRINADYLAKKTTGEMRDFGMTLGIFDDPAARSFLEGLGRKTFKACKKPELVSVFLESGADLAGKVPDEILGK